MRSVKKFSSNKILLFLIVVGFIGLAIEKVFSLPLARKIGGKGVIPAEKNLLLTDPDGLLSKKEAWKIYSSLDNFVATVYSVGRNEWLEKIAKDLNVPSLAIRSTNNLEDPLLRPSQKIMIQNKTGMVHVSKKDESLDSVFEIYKKLGSRKENILEANALDEVTFLKDGKLYLVEGSVLWIPDAKRSFPWFTKPVHWTRISSSFGMRRHPIYKIRRRHNGYDLVAPHGSPVYAAQAGEVTFVGWLGGYGNVIDVRHPGITTRYGHLSAMYVQVGQKVKRKQFIGRVGSTGISTGPHLHFEVKRNSDGKPVRPGRYLY